jgi:hypothetical protein
LADAVRKTVSDARAALLTAGVAYGIVFAALGRAESLALRLDLIAGDPKEREGSAGSGASRDIDKSQVLVMFLIDLLEHRRGYRRSRRAWMRLRRMPEALISESLLERG